MPGFFIHSSKYFLTNVKIAFATVLRRTRRKPVHCLALTA